MNRIHRLWPLMMILLVLLLAACGGGAAAGPESGAEEGGEEAPAPEQVIVTMDSATTGIDMKIGQSAVMKLDPAYTWTFAVTPALVAEVDKAFTPTDDSQAQITAKLAGSAVIQATGKPKCKDENPPCDTARAQLNIKMKVTP